MIGEFNMKTLSQSKRAAVILAVIILLQSIYVIATFQSRHTFQSDEIWSYGLANSFYRPFIYLDPQIALVNQNGQPCDNAGEWLDGEFFNDYITVGENDKFRYDSVIYNQAHDMHPPLYFMILHTISSFFPGQFSWYFAFPINIISLCVTQIFLYLLAYELTQRRRLSLLVCLSYACSLMALFTFTFIRHYAMLTMWCTIITYLYVKFFKSDFNLKKYLPPIIITVLTASFTQQMALIYTGALTLSVCVYLLLKKRFELMFKFGFALATTAAVYISVWPYAIGASPIHADNHMFDYWSSVKRYVYKMLEVCFGIKSLIPMSHYHMPYFVGFLLALVFIAVPLIVFRRDAWCQRLFAFFGRLFKRIYTAFQGVGAMLPIFLAAIFIVILVLAKVSDFGKMGAHRIRYLAFVAPVFTASVIIILHTAVNAVFKSERAAVAVTVLFVTVCAAVGSFADTEFITGSQNVPYSDIAAMLDEKAVVVSSTPPTHMQYTPELLRNTDKVWFDNCDKFLANSDEYTDRLKGEDEFYFMLCASMITYEKDMDELKKKYPLFFKPEATKEDMKKLNVQFIDDYIDHFESMDFVDNIEFAAETELNGFSVKLFKVTTVQ